MLNPTLRLERFLISALDLSSTVFFTRQHVSSLLVWVSDGVVARCAEEHRVNSGALFDRSGYDVAWVDHHFFWVLSSWVNSGYWAQITCI